MFETSKQVAVAGQEGLDPLLSFLNLADETGTRTTGAES